MKIIRLLLFFMLAIQNPVFSSIHLIAQGQTSSDAVSNTNAIEDLNPFEGKRTLWELFDMAEEFSYFLLATFLLGILFIFQQWYVLLREKRDAHRIPVEQLNSMTLVDIRKNFHDTENIYEKREHDGSIRTLILRKIFLYRKASAFQLLNRLFKIFEVQNSTRDFNEEISTYIQYLKDKFNPFTTRLSFLSDTAGALGLLGTVWGMFLVFYRVSLDQSEVLHGMGIALSTTIIGLIISIILNSLTTVVSNIFDKQLERISKIANLFHDRLMIEEQNLSTKVSMPKNAGVSGKMRSPSVQEEWVRSEERQTMSHRGHSLELNVTSGDRQAGIVNNKLSKPIIVQVTDEYQNPLQGEAVIFSAEDGAGLFQNDERSQRMLTDVEGKASTFLYLGQKVGEKTIRVSLENNGYKQAKILIDLKPSAPIKMIELKGNYQSGQVGQELPEPFQVGVFDKFDNPIPQYKVVFSLKKGTGVFQSNRDSRFETLTDEKGVAEARFIVGTNRGAQEIEAEAKKLAPSKMTFEVFAR